MTIPEQAVQAASEIICAHDNEQWGDSGSPDMYHDLVGNMLTAALPHLPLGLEVKKLDWVKHPTASLWRAETEFGVYQVWSSDMSGWLFDGYLGDKIDPVNTKSEDEAKAAAQADFERRVRECVVAKPVDVAAVLETALLNEATELAFTAISRMRAAHISCLDLTMQAEGLVRNIKAALRALSADPAQGEKWQPIETARPLDEWHEDYGDVVWWAWDENKKEWLGEAPFISHPLSSDWPDYHTHWTPLPKRPAALAQGGGE